MPRPCLSLAVALAACAPVFAQDPPTPDDPAAAFAKIDDLRKTRPSGREAIDAYRKELKKLAKEFVEAWEPKADTPGVGIYLAKGHLIVATHTLNKPRVATRHLDQAEGHAKTWKDANPADPEPGYVLKSIATLRPAVARLMAVVKKRADADARREALYGKPAPDVEIDEVPDGAPGQVTKLADYRGKVVLLYFWATWSAPCRRVAPFLARLKKKHGDALVVLGVTKFYKRGYVPGADGKGEAKKGLDQDAEREVNRQCAKALGINFPILFGGKAFKAYHVLGTPQLVLIGKQGKVRYVKVGAGKMDQLDPELEDCFAD